MSSIRRFLFAVTVGVSAPALVAAQQPAAPRAALAQNLDAAGVAIKGFDPVAYFVAARPMKGSPTLTAQHQGATYWFATESNRSAFLAAPDRYVPQYGGYCAMGVAGNAKFDIDPNAWRVEQGKLYLNKDLRTQVYWRLNMERNIEKADRNWPVLGLH